MSQARYNILEKAFQYLGEKEVEGPGSNRLIITWFRNWGVSWQKDDSKLAWCSVFMNQVADEAGVELSGKLNARSWLEIGTPTEEPKPGDIVIYWRSSISSWKGHVGIFIREDDTHIWTLGGNQSNSVNITKYSKSRLLGYRMPLLNNS